MCLVSPKRRYLVKEQVVSCGSQFEEAGEPLVSSNSARFLVFARLFAFVESRHVGLDRFGVVKTWERKKKTETRETDAMCRQDYLSIDVQ